mmetsp:Transcript_28853/g.47808  ORF Transcript_28853/g.47808 Transcript_28853/m.47808 type:complete len:234 (+) Transcript_28853:140-841(+)
MAAASPCAPWCSPSSVCSQQLASQATESLGAWWPSFLASGRCPPTSTTSDRSSMPRFSLSAAPPSSIRPASSAGTRCQRPRCTTWSAGSHWTLGANAARGCPRSGLPPALAFRCRCACASRMRMWTWALEVRTRLIPVAAETPKSCIATAAVSSAHRARRWCVSREVHGLPCPAAYRVPIRSISFLISRKKLHVTTSLCRRGVFSSPALIGSLGRRFRTASSTVRSNCLTAGE